MMKYDITYKGKKLRYGQNVIIVNGEQKAPGTIQSITIGAIITVFVVPDDGKVGSCVYLHNDGTPANFFHSADIEFPEGEKEKRREG